MGDLKTKQAMNWEWGVEFVWFVNMLCLHCSNVSSSSNVAEPKYGVVSRALSFESGVRSIKSVCFLPCCLRLCIYPGLAVLSSSYPQEFSLMRRGISEASLVFANAAALATLPWPHAFMRTLVSCFVRHSCPRVGQRAKVRLNPGASFDVGRGVASA